MWNPNSSEAKKIKMWKRAKIQLFLLIAPLHLFTVGAVVTIDLVIADEFSHPHIGFLELRVDESLGPAGVRAQGFDGIHSMLERLHHAFQFLLIFLRDFVVGDVSESSQIFPRFVVR